MEGSTCELKAQKKANPLKHEELERRLMEWFIAVQNDGGKVTDTLLREKALEINTEIGGIRTFEAGFRWLHKFRERNGIYHIPVEEEKNVADFDAAKKFTTDFQEFIETNNYDVENIYNAEETMINLGTLPTKSLEYKDFSSSGGEIQTHHITALVCANAAGTHALPLLLIGSEAKPKSIEKDLHSLPVEYISQKLAWITSSIFTNWFKEHFITLVKQRQEKNGIKGKVLLIIDNAESHPSLEELNRIDDDVEVISLTRSVAAVIQPMNQGVIQKMKNVFRKNILQSILNEERASLTPHKYLGSLDVKKFCYIFADAFTSLTSQNLKNAWHKLLPSIEEICTSDNENLLSEINEIFYRIPAFTDYPEESLRRWLNQDKYDPGFCLGDHSDFVSKAEIPLEIRK